MIHIRSLLFHYPGENGFKLDIPDFQVEPGEKVAVIGPSGSGKTTFFNVVTNLLTATAGKVYYESQDITNFKPHIIANMGLTRTFQAGKLAPGMTALQNVMVGAHTKTNIDVVETFLGLPWRPSAQEDKIKIINGFKKVDTIAESQEKYKAFLTEMKETKPTLTESVEDKVSASIAPSSKQKIEEAKEVTAYADNEHVNKMKRLIEYAENRGKKKSINS